jgi:NTP pyrophosphatase (non-canonical NTP hydrolase)
MTYPLRKSDQVRYFTKSMGQPLNVEPTPELALLRQSLILEEAKEASAELLRPQVDKAALTKELADILYVVYGTAITFGLPLDTVFNRVHASNMSKLVDGKPLYRDDGKVLKGPNYQPPKLDDLFDE